MYINRWNLGEVAEWFMALVLKTSEGESPPWVQIPPSPPYKRTGCQIDIQFF